MSNEGRNNRVPDLAEQPRNQYTINYTPQELEVINEARRKDFFKLSLPASAGGVWGAYYLQRKGIWTKKLSPNPIIAYLPKCAAMGFVMYSVANIYSTYRTLAKLKEIDGNYRRFLRKEPQIPVGPEAGRGGGGRGVVADREFTGDVNQGLQNDFNVHVQDQQTLKSLLGHEQDNSTDDNTGQQAMTYADLRQRNRLQEDTHNSQRTRYPQSPPQRPAGSPPTPQYPNPPTPPTPSPSQPVPGGETPGSKSSQVKSRPTPSQEKTNMEIHGHS